MSHGYHERGEDGRPFLCDGCERCEEQAGDVGVHLDAQSFREAWSIMVGVEYGDDHYRSEAEAKLGQTLYRVSLVMERAFGLNLRGLVVPTTERSR